MFDKIMGTNKIGQWLEQGLTPQQIEANYLPELNRFKAEREKYLIYGSKVSAPSTQPGAEQPGQADENQPAEPGQEQGQPGQVEPAPGTEQPGQALPPLKVIVQGENVVFDSEPYIDGQNRLMVPVRAILEALGATVDWDEITRTVSIQGQGHSLLLTIDSKQAVVDGQKRTMDTTPVIRNSRTMLPARYVGEYLGFTVQWDEKTRTVTVE